MKLGIGEILRGASEQPNHRARVEHLRRHGSPALVTAISLALDPRIVWDLDRGWKPDYVPTEFFDQEATLYQTMRKMDRFLVGGYPGLTREKKQLLFVQLLESVAPLDAEYLVAAKDKKLPWPGLGRKVINEAFPGTLPEPAAREGETEE